MGLWETYRLRLRRKRLRIRAIRKQRDLTPVVRRTASIRPGAILLFCTFRNEAWRLPHFLDHYRRLGVDHFLFVDNASTDGGLGALADAPDVSLWTTAASYRRARYGADWLNGLAMRFGHGHWCLTVDADELLIYPFHETRPLPALTAWLDDSGVRSFGAMLLDLYPKGPLSQAHVQPGQDPTEVAGWFDPGNYSIRPDPRLRNLCIRGGPRGRAFFPDRPDHAPALNKIPLVKWGWRTVYASSTHALLPRGLNLTYDRGGGEKACGVLLHTKFTAAFPARAAEEAQRRQHYARAREYAAYAETGERVDLWTPWSEQLINWRQLEILGLLSRGHWA